MRRCFRFLTELVWCAAVSALAMMSAANAQEYPVKPIHVFVGPGPDILARIVGEKLGETLGQAVVVELRPAAGGIVAADTVVKAAPDGHTLLLSTGSYTINSVLQPRLPYDFARDLTPITLMATLPFVLVVHPAVPAGGLKDLVAMARTKPGGLNYASSGNGTPPHLAGELLKQLANINVVHVPYKGAAPAVTDVAGGQVQMMFVPAPAALPLIRSGKLRAIAVSSPQRYRGLPEVPTVAEQGFPDFAIVGWNGLHAPARTPSAVIDRLNREVARIMRLREVQERAFAAGFESVGSSIAEFDVFQKQDIARAGNIIKAGNVQPD